MHNLCHPTRFRKPARHGGPRHIGEIADGVVRSIGLRAISFHLSRAAETIGDEALMALAEADAIRRSLGLSWGQYVAGRRVVYALAELDAWAASRTFTSTSEVDEARK